MTHHFDWMPRYLDLLFYDNPIPLPLVKAGIECVLYANFFLFNSRTVLNKHQHSWNLLSTTINNSDYMTEPMLLKTHLPGTLAVCTFSFIISNA